MTNASVLWAHRGILGRTAVVSILLALVIAFVIPNQYESTARIMPPETAGGSTALLGGNRGPRRIWWAWWAWPAACWALAAAVRCSLTCCEAQPSAAILSIDFNCSRFITNVTGSTPQNGWRDSTAIVEDKKSGVISITVEDSDPHRARDLAQAYLDELNLLVNRTNTSSARQERMFIEHRLDGAQQGLERAQKEMSEFASTHTAIDMKEQTRATVDAAAKLEGQLIFEQSELDSLEQIYGDENVRVRSAHARVAELQRQLEMISGTSTPLGQWKSPETQIRLQHSIEPSPTIPPFGKFHGLPFPTQTSIVACAYRKPSMKCSHSSTNWHASRRPRMSR